MIPHETDIRQALRQLNIEVADVINIDQSPSSWTFEADQNLVVRFPADRNAARKLLGERQILPEIARRVTFTVPEPVLEGSWRGLPFYGYTKVPGWAALPHQVEPASLAQLLRELHAFPIDRARRLLHCDGTLAEWRAKQAAALRLLDGQVLPLLDAPIAALARASAASFMKDPLDCGLVMVHGGLRRQCLLYDDRFALVDFENASVGDPVIDIASLWLAFGPSIVRQAAVQYGILDAGFASRLRFYLWMASATAVLAALRVGASSLDRLLAELQRQIVDRQRVCAAVLRKGCILLARYDDSYWTLPGGAIEAGETPEEAVLRELHEETGLEGVVIRSLFSEPYAAGTSWCYLVDAPSGSPRRTGDPQVTDVKWFPVNDVAGDIQVAQVLRAFRPREATDSARP
jgi:8-oxo-dGTP diphosphatase